MNKAITHRNEIEALPAVRRLRNAVHTLRSLNTSSVRADAQIVLERAAWHLENQITALYQLEIENSLLWGDQRKDPMSQMSLGLPTVTSASPRVECPSSRENIHPEDTRLFEASYSYAAHAITSLSREFPFLPPPDLTKIQKVIQDRYRQWIIEERSFCMACGSPRVAAIEDDHGAPLWECRDCKAVEDDVDLVNLGEEIEQLREAA